MVIAHPDDDALFGGPFQRSHVQYNWHVVCATYARTDPRGLELAAWQACNGCKRVDFLGLPDDPRDFETGTSSITAEEVAHRLAALDIDAELCLTHNSIGEYGHIHHVIVARGVRQWLTGRSMAAIEFGYGLPDCDIRLDVRDFLEDAIACYPSQEHLIRAHHAEERLCRTGTYRRIR
jgi:LmbE family N-acetylglucosaminyl deacetylase